MRKNWKRKRTSKDYFIINWGNCQSAVKSFEILKDFPGSAFETEAKYLLVKSSFELAENSIEEKEKSATVKP